MNCAVLCTPSYSHSQLIKKKKKPQTDLIFSHKLCTAAQNHVKRFVPSYGDKAGQNLMISQAVKQQ